MIRMMIVDDHILLTDSLRMMLEKYPDIEIVAIAHNGEDAIKKCAEVNPDVILMDIKMPLLGGIEAAVKIKQIRTDIKIIILTSLEDSKYVVDSFIHGVDAYLMKDTPSDKLKTLIECVICGFFVMSDCIKHLLRNELELLKDASPPTDIIDSLKEEDVEMIKCISEGKNNYEIAELLGYANGTVKNKITRLLEITGTGNRAQLVMFALRNNLL